MTRVFLAEDSPEVLRRLRGYLDGAPGVEVVGDAATAGGAIAAILATRPDLVFVDLNLTQGSGFDVLRALCHRLPAVDFYMLSNFAAEPYRQLAGRLGAKGYFDKTREFERVRDLVAQRAADLTH